MGRDSTQYLRFEDFKHVVFIYFFTHVNLKYILNNCNENYMHEAIAIASTVTVDLRITLNVRSFKTFTSLDALTSIQPNQRHCT